MSNAKFYQTHHSPIGAWASLTFGAPDCGMGIEVQNPGADAIGSMLIGAADQKEMKTIGFIKKNGEAEKKTAAEGDAEQKKNFLLEKMLEMYQILPEAAVTRTLTPSMDRYQAGRLSFTVYTPYRALTDPLLAEIPKIECVPGLLMDVEYDNTDGEEDVTVYFGVMLDDMKRLYAEEGAEPALTCRNDWMFASDPADGSFAVRGMDAVRYLRAGTGHVHENGPGFLCKRIPAGEKGCLPLVWCVYQNAGSTGACDTVYYYNRYFASMREIPPFLFAHADEIRKEAISLDRELTEERVRENRMTESQAELFGQSLRAYYASTQLLLDGEKRVHWNVCEGAYLWRNTMDLCADHLAWELYQNPWVVRQIMDEYIDCYTYEDQVYFADKDEISDGGISFTHDMGCFFHYSAHGKSGYERENDSRNGFYFYMTTEELLNGIYCIAAYAIVSGDTKWLGERLELLLQLMTSLENRDAQDPADRNGILNGVSTKSGGCHLESTTYDALDHSLLEASGNLYVFIKTIGSLLLLQKCFERTGCGEGAERASSMLKRCMDSLPVFYDETHKRMRANAYADIEGYVIAAVEALVVPGLCGVASDLPDRFMEYVREHAQNCLQEGVCINKETGGLQLSSSSMNTWPSKTILTIFALEHLLKLAVPDSVKRELEGWCQVSARRCTISDQIQCDTRQVVGATYYPRIITSAVWIW